MSEKFIGYFRLLDACAEAGCPVCRRVEDDSRRYLGTLLYELVTDPDTRRALRGSWGLCHWHTWMLLQIEDAPFGAAILYEDMLRQLIRRVRHLGDRPARASRGWRRRLLGERRRAPALVAAYRRRDACPACRSVVAAERRYLAALVEWIDEDEMRAAYARSEGLCAPHLLATVDFASGSAGLRELVARTIPKWQRALSAVSSFVGKHDYRNREPYTEAEARSYLLAFELLTGARGVFGDDRRRAAAALGLATPAEGAAARPGDDGGAGA